jgi:UDP-N-acetylmuramoylalanine-D-glutamate ligase
VAWVTLGTHVRIAQRTAPGDAWTETDLTPDAVADQQLIAVTGSGGKATVLIFSPRTDRLSARTQS